LAVRAARADLRASLSPVRRQRRAANTIGLERRRALPSKRGARTPYTLARARLVEGPPDQFGDQRVELGVRWNWSRLGSGARRILAVGGFELRLQRRDSLPLGGIVDLCQEQVHLLEPAQDFRAPFELQ
jgi:hypothetical protein